MFEKGVSHIESHWYVLEGESDLSLPPPSRMAATLATPIPPTTTGAGVRGPAAVGAGKALFCSRGMGETLFGMKTL